MKTESVTAKELQEIIEQKDVRIAELEALVKYYQEQFRLSQVRKYGAKSERTGIVGQISIFNEAEYEEQPDAPESVAEEVISYTRKKRQGKRSEDISALPVEQVVHELPEEEQVCPECGEALHVMGHETSKELIIIPAQVKVREHIIAVYSCRSCEKTSDHVPILKANAPKSVIRGSLASPSAIAHIMTQKYVMYSPLYRQEKEFQRHGINLSRQTMANWIIKSSEDWLDVIHRRMRALLLEREVLYADETTIQVLHEPGRKAQTKSYMWMYRTGGDEKPIIIYEYQETRSSEHPRRFLAGFKGFLHTDGYAAYHKLENVTVVGCWGHMRRRYDDALKIIPKDSRKGSAAEKGLNYCNKLFELERSYEKLEPEERYARRLAESKPIAEAYFSWVETMSALPASLIGKALNYARGQKPWLMNVYLDGRLELSNNRSERSIKPFVIGRKNFLFCNTPKGAGASSVVFSIIETAKENGLDPFNYLAYLLETLPNVTSNKIDSLLPWSESLPAECRSQKKKP